MKAIALFSGGLDSILAVLLIKQQGIDVDAINFITPFFKGEGAEKTAEILGIRLYKMVLPEDDYIKMLLNPVYGYGKNMNPCIDCHALMLRVAGNLMKELGASFIITGEVLGERPKSQNRKALFKVAEASGYKGYILRPLSAKLLPPTIPELEGWVDRSLLLDIMGRSRKKQLELAKRFNLTDYPSPAGGCLLTDPGYSKRLKELLENEDKTKLSYVDFELLRYGRHFRISGFKLIVGRDMFDNQKIKEVAARLNGVFIKVKDYPGPTAFLVVKDEDDLKKLLCLDENNNILKKACSIVVRYSDAPKDTDVAVNVYNRDSVLLKELLVLGMSQEEIDALRIGG